MPFNVRRPQLNPADAPPQTLEAAYSRFVGGPFDEPDWSAYEAAIDKILRNEVPVNGHHPDCRNAHFPSGLDDIYADTEDGVIVSKCRICGYVIARMLPDRTEVVAR